MHRDHSRARKSFALLVFLAIATSAWAGAELQYQNRGDRYEGVKPKPVSGYDIELISARVDYKEEAKQIPDRLKVKLYLEQPSQVYLTVRELDYKYYYWLDRVQPAGGWRSGFDNVFAWPAQDVIRQLGEIQMYDLGVVARLDKPEPSKAERVAPVIFYHSRVPATIEGYLFTFKTSSDTRLTCSVYKEGETAPLFTQVSQRQRGGRPFTVRWATLPPAKGSYRLVVRGYSLDDNAPVDQTVSFQHQPVAR
jgi:hypothetical protein